MQSATSRHLKSGRQSDRETDRLLGASLCSVCQYVAYKLHFEVIAYKHLCHTLRRHVPSPSTTPV